MYVIQANACDLPNSETPLSQAQIDAQNSRVQRTGNRFVRGNITLGDICNGLTPPAPLPSCGDMTSSLALLNSGAFPIPPGGASALPSPLTRANLVSSAPSDSSDSSLSTAPLTFDDLVAAIQGGTAAPATGAPASSAPPGTLPGSNGGAVAAPAPVMANPGGGLQICLPRMFTPGGMSGLGARSPRGTFTRGRRGSRGMGGAGLGDYLMTGAVRLIDGTVISDPANTTPTAAQALPYQCGADPGNQAARYWFSFYGLATTRPPCTDPSCAPWKPSYCTPAAAPAAFAAPPAPATPPAVYPYGALQMQMDSYVPARCNGSQPAIPGGVRAGGANGSQVCFSLASPVLWGTVAALGLAIWATMPKGRG